MGQTLTVLPALSNPPAVGEQATLSANLAAIANLSNKEVLAIRVYSKVIQLAANGGTDYTADFPLLVSSTANLLGYFNIATCPLNEPYARIDAILDWNAAYTADNNLSTDVQTLVNNIGILRSYPEATLYQMRQFLGYKLAE